MSDTYNKILKIILVIGVYVSTNCITMDAIEFCKKSDLDTIKKKYELEKWNENILMQVFNIACSTNNLDLVTWICSLNIINVRAQQDVALRNACCRGYIKLAKFLHGLGCDIHAEVDYAFRYGCQNGHFELVQWIYSLKNVNIHAESEDAFISSCTYGHLGISKWLYELDRKINIKSIEDNVFMKCLARSHYHIAEWLISIGADIHAKNDAVFRSCCVGGYGEAAKWIYGKGNVDIHYSHDYAFMMTCRNGHFEIAQWLYGLGDVNIHANDDYAFLGACSNGFVGIAKWLYELGGIDVRYKNHAVFNNACRGGQIPVAEWLVSICDDYVIKVEGGRIISYSVVTFIDKFLAGSVKTNDVCVKYGIKERDRRVSDDCVICYSNDEDQLVSPCKHNYCIRCLFVLIKQQACDVLFKCPFCTRNAKFNECHIARFVTI